MNIKIILEIITKVLGLLTSYSEQKKNKEMIENGRAKEIVENLARTQDYVKDSIKIRNRRDEFYLAADKLRADKYNRDKTSNGC